MESSLQLEINVALDIWKNMLLEKFLAELEYIYAKGSSIKQWNSKIDYVPQISDVDIHVKVRDGVQCDLLKPSMELSRQIGSDYEKRFKKFFENQSIHFTHLPRIQLVLINKIKDTEREIFYQRPQDVKIIYGNPIFAIGEQGKKVRKQDRMALESLEKTLEKIPLDLLDRSDYLEYYAVLRRINYVVSPSPIRLLTQLLITENPYDIWAWNRTIIVKELKKLSLTNLAVVYEQYYTLAWDLFEQDFQNTALFLKLIATGLEVLELVNKEYLALNE